MDIIESAKSWFRSLLGKAKEEIAKVPDRLHVEAVQEINKLDEQRDPLKKLIREKGEAAADDMVDLMQAKALDLEMGLLKKVFPKWEPGQRA